MALTTHRTREATEDDNMHPIAPDGTWQGAWPPEVWVVQWRLDLLGYRKRPVAEVSQITDAARQRYVERYGHEPPRRGRRNRAYTVVFEHERVAVIDEAAEALWGQPTGRRRLVDPLRKGHN